MRPSAILATIRSADESRYRAVHRIAQRFLARIVDQPEVQFIHRVRVAEAYFGYDAHSDALRYLQGGGASATLNCGYGHGFSVLEVIDTVKRVSGVDFPVEFAPPRPGDPTQIVAASDRARNVLGWKPQRDDLSTIVGDALAWQKKLMTRNT